MQGFKPKIHPGAAQAMNAGTGGLHRPVAASAGGVARGPQLVPTAQQLPVRTVSELLHRLPPPAAPVSPTRAGPGAAVATRLAQLQQMVQRQRQYLMSGGNPHGS